jgi:hypothetical protein
VRDSCPSRKPSMNSATSLPAGSWVGQEAIASV